MTVSISFPHAPALDARAFTWRERIGHGYVLGLEVALPELTSTDEWLGKPATVRATASGGDRSFYGVVTKLEVRAVHGGASIAHLSVSSRLGPLAHREDVRAFEHVDVAEIADQVLARWNLKSVKRLSSDALAKHEFRVQYRESDEVFMRRICEEEGVSLLLEPIEGNEQIVLDDRPGAREAKLALAHAERLGSSAVPSYVSLSSRRELRVSALNVRDNDFALPRNVELLATATEPTNYPALESYELDLGSFFADSADTATGDRSDAARGKLSAAKRLQSKRHDAAVLSFKTNCLSLHAGAVVRLEGEVDAVLVTSIHTHQTPEGAIEVSVEGVNASAPWAPARETHRPVVKGVHTARVVGPEGQDVHVDTHGRVRVEFVWDRRSPQERSSAWVRVSQSWAGPGMGLVTVPRVGQDVLVGFLDGNADAPFVVGRLFDASSPHPYALPQHQTKTVLRTQSVPGGEGFNELSFEDSRGSELVYLRAERDRETHVRAEDRLRIDASREKQIRGNERVEVGGARTARIGSIDITEVGQRFSASIAGGRTYLDMSEGMIRLTTGDATFELVGPDARIDAKGNVSVSAASVTLRGETTIVVEAGANVRVESAGGDVVVQGGPMVYINPKDAEAHSKAGLEALPVEVPADVDIVDNLDDARESATYDNSAPNGIADRLAPGGSWDFLSRGEDQREFHFFHAALVSRASGLPVGAAMRQEGARYVARVGADPRRGDPGNGVFGGTAPWGLEPKDAETMQRGAAFYDENLEATS